MKIFRALIYSNIYIALAAVSLTIATQIQLGIKPQWQPYLLLIFFAVIFEYNLHSLISVLIKKEDPNSQKQRLSGLNGKKLWYLSSISATGIFISAFFVKEGLLLVLIPIALLTVIYSFLIFGERRYLFGIREIPFLKLLLIAIVWTATTIFLPVIQANINLYNFHVMLLFAERFFFIFAIALPFDIRDMEMDRSSGLKTIPLLLGENKAQTLSYLSLLVFFLISFFHYKQQNDWFTIVALGISALSTYLFVRLKTFRNKNWYYDVILDGTMFLQGLLVMAFYYLK